LDIFQGHWTVPHQISQKRCVIRQKLLLIGNHTLAFDWSYFWWPWSTLEGHFSLGCHFHVYFSNPSHAFASHGLPATAALLVTFYCKFFKWGRWIWKWRARKCKTWKCAVILYRCENFKASFWKYSLSATVYIPSVCPYCIKTAERIIEVLLASDRSIILVFRHHGLSRNFDGFTPNEGAKYKGCSDFRPICCSRKR